MGKHVITLTVELDDTNKANTDKALQELATGLMSEAIDTLWQGSPGRLQDGYAGPYLLTVNASLDGQELDV